MKSRRSHVRCQYFAAGVTFAAVTILLAPLRQGSVEVRSQHASFIPLLAATGVKESEDFRRRSTASPETASAEPLVRTPGERTLKALPAPNSEEVIEHDFYSPRIRWQYLNTSTRAALDDVLANQSAWSVIELHGSTAESIQQLERVHRLLRGQKGHPYDVVISDTVSTGTAVANDGTLRICVMGDFHASPPGKGKLAALDEVIDYVNIKTGKLRVRAHDAGCLGTAFPIRQIEKALTVD